MSQPQPLLDEQGEAHDALTSAVANYGPRILENPHMLGNVVTDLVPDLPREQSLLIAAAEAGVAADLSQHIRNENLDPGTAVQLAARMLADKKAIDTAASVWVTTEYARALGYAAPVSVPPSGAGPTLPQSPVSVPPSGPGAQAPQWQSAQNPQGPPGAQMPQAPPGQSWPPPQGPLPQGPPAQGPPQGPAPLSWPPQGAPASSWPPAQPPSGGPPPSTNWRKRGPVIAAIAVAAIVVLYVVTAAVAQTFPFAKSHPAAAPTPSHTSSHRASASPSPKPTVASLTQLLPGDIDDPSSQCKPDSAPPFNAPGLVQGLDCTDPGISGGSVVAYQMDSFANYQKAWASFNNWWGFNSATPGSSCPPAGSDKNAEGTTTWKDNFFPYRTGQVLECEWVGTSLNIPAYAWTFPTENAFIIADGATNSTFSALDSWWTNAAPLNSPSPSAP